MKIAPLFSEKTVFSFEVFPPKKTSPIETVYQTLEELQDLHPDFISVTLGAGGSGNGENTIAIARRLQEQYGITSMSHLPCIHCTKEKLMPCWKHSSKAALKTSSLCVATVSRN